MELFTFRSYPLTYQMSWKKRTKRIKQQIIQWQYRKTTFCEKLIEDFRERNCFSEKKWFLDKQESLEFHGSS